MKKYFKQKGFIYFIVTALFFSLILLPANNNAYAASSTADVTHIEVNAEKEFIQELKHEEFTYPVGDEFHQYMSDFEGYVLNTIQHSSISIGGAERVVAEVSWQKRELKIVEEMVEIPYETIEKEDKTLDKGERVIEQSGIPGEKSVTFNVTYIGGEERYREITDEKIVAEPVNEIVRVGTKVTEVKEEQETESVPFETIEKEDSNLDKGKSIVKQDGVPGEKTITYNVTYVNGEEVEREIVSEKLTVEPIQEIILIGTKVTEVKEEKEKESVPYEIIEKEDPDLDRGTRLVEQTGVEGEKDVTYEVTYVNGVETEREIISEKVVKEPISEIVLVGIKDIVVVIEEESTEEIPYEIVEKEDPNLEKGQKLVVQDGASGEKTVVYEITYVNEEEVERKVISEEIIFEPKNKIIKIGTKIEDENQTEQESNDRDEDLSQIEQESNNKDEETKETDEGINEESTNKDVSNQLPNTSTSLFNLLSTGFITLAIGIIGIYNTRRKISKVNN